MTVYLIQLQSSQHHITHIHAHRTYLHVYINRRVFALTRSGAGVDLPGLRRGRSDMSDREEDTPAASGALGGSARSTADRHDEDIIVLGANPTSHLTMPHLNAAVSSRMRTFPAIFTSSSWSSASSFAGF